MQNLNFLTDDDVQVLKEMLAWRKSQYINARIRTPHIPLQDQTPDVYIAWTQDGIPAMTGPAENETGTSSGIYDSDLNMPGEGLCTIFRVLRVAASSGTSSGSTEDLPLPALYPIGQSPITVLNISGEEIRPLQFIVVNRDKFGNWIAQQPQGTSGGIGPPGPGGSLEIVGGSEGSGDITSVTKITADYTVMGGIGSASTWIINDASGSQHGVINLSQQVVGAGGKVFTSSGTTAPSATSVFIANTNTTSIPTLGTGEPLVVDGTSGPGTGSGYAPSIATGPIVVYGDMANASTGQVTDGPSNPLFIDQLGTCTAVPNVAAWGNLAFYLNSGDPTALFRPLQWQFEGGLTPANNNVGCWMLAGNNPYVPIDIILGNNPGSTGFGVQDAYGGAGKFFIGQTATDNTGNEFKGGILTHSSTSPLPPPPSGFGVGLPNYNVIPILNTAFVYTGSSIAIPNATGGNITVAVWCAVSCFMNAISGSTTATSVQVQLQCASGAQVSQVNDLILTSLPSLVQGDYFNSGVVMSQFVIPNGGASVDLYVGGTGSPSNQTVDELMDIQFQWVQVSP